MTKKAERDQDREEARKQLRKMLKPGATVYCVLRHRSRSGMMRHISLLVADKKGGMFDISFMASRATNTPIDRDNGGLKMGGCGMDMGFAAVYGLSRALFPRGFACAGERCPSNDHSNGEQVLCGDCGNGLIADVETCKACNGQGSRRVPFPRGKGVRHTGDGGYALRHQWI